jgi:hypothetical protein
MSFNVNFLGHLPYNPDQLPERRYITGTGTDRPIGFIFQEIIKLYWTVRSYEVIISSSITTDDIFEQFLRGTAGGTDIRGSVAGLGSINLGASNFSLRGYTKIKNLYTKRIRKERDGIFNGVTQKTVELDNTVSPNILTSSIVNVNEGTLCSPGPIHTLVGSSGYLKIDMSDIIQSKGLYWPKILLTLQSSSLSFSSLVGFGNNINVLGGVNFSNYGIISLYGTNTVLGSSVTASVVGNINIGKRCCDRFYWDNGDDGDSGRFNDDTCKDACKSTVAPVVQNFNGTRI